MKLLSRRTGASFFLPGRMRGTDARSPFDARPQSMPATLSPRSRPRTPSSPPRSSTKRSTSSAARGTRLGRSGSCATLNACLTSRRSILQTRTAQSAGPCTSPCASSRMSPSENWSRLWWEARTRGNRSRSRGSSRSRRVRGCCSSRKTLRTMPTRRSRNSGSGSASLLLSQTTTSRIGPCSSVSAGTFSPRAFRRTRHPG